MGKQNAVWITGASSGIGKELAKKFSESNFNVIASARRIEQIEKINGEKKSSAKIIPLQNDISDFTDLSEKIINLKNEFNINCLINNAGITSFKPFVENSIEEIENIINVNLLGAIYSTKLVLPEMIENKSGTIINILSVAAKTVFTKSSVYAASKAGLDYFSKVLREEVRNHNIKIINIFPGATSTEIWPSNVLIKYSDKMMNPENLAELIFNLVNTDKNLVAEEIVVRPITGDL
ncbi:MAG: SDR family NAD(P)-dependent oxidoreductase [Ignavibacteriae bacterium]|nr:SDR family NAD(P)-dependent oxidoreductase [Ignavibacteriota bacterium]